MMYAVKHDPALRSWMTLIDLVLLKLNYAVVLTAFNTFAIVFINLSVTTCRSQMSKFLIFGLVKLSQWFHSYDTFYRMNEIIAPNSIVEINPCHFQKREFLIFV